jgi:hypothetical protein
MMSTMTSITTRVPNHPAMEYPFCELDQRRCEFLAQPSFTNATALRARAGQEPPCEVGDGHQGLPGIGAAVDDGPAWLSVGDLVEMTTYSGHDEQPRSRFS